MLKRAVLPFQVVLLRRRMCSGCTQPLDKAPRSQFRRNKAMVQCKCRRRYILDLDTNIYKRASFEEEREYLTNLK